ncbi:hypothetical protein [Natronogracilivirga saccharolytica]|uniref:Uncharacterized protein n=1 Tax=Natronogracilivirga saccharolytica TaxID=2812953 RepID=A0A8J7S7P1_9BACT|nr:hypothetical protein [Natronogracilivirga saccharolytica]MBP3193498.1 hypothetical protein [Natronogracilivirga saccharolytica]
MKKEFARNQLLAQQKQFLVEVFFVQDDVAEKLFLQILQPVSIRSESDAE